MKQYTELNLESVPNMKWKCRGRVKIVQHLKEDQKERTVLYQIALDKEESEEEYQIALKKEEYEEKYQIALDKEESEEEDYTTLDVESEKWNNDAMMKYEAYNKK